MTASSIVEHFAMYYNEPRLSRSGPVSPSQIVQRVVDNGEDIRVIDLSIVRRNLAAFREHFSFAEHYIAVKAVTQPNIFSLLANEEVRFEIATLGELSLCFEYGAPVANVLCSHPAKDRFEIVQMSRASVPLFVSDNVMDLDLMAEHSPGARVLIRIQAHRSEHDHEKCLTTKGFDCRFGVEAEQALELACHAAERGIRPVGLAFHVGIQQEEPSGWDYSIGQAASIFRAASRRGIKMDTLNLGGGFPATYTASIPPLAAFGQAIRAALDASFSGSIPYSIIEPGRSISAMAGVTLGRVINVKPSPHDPSRPIVTLSTGRYSAGLFGVGMGISFYRPNRANTELRPLQSSGQRKAYLYGKVLSEVDQPTSAFGRTQLVPVPEDLRADDLVAFSGTGAYTGELFTHMCSKSTPTTIVFDHIAG